MLRQIKNALISVSDKDELLKILKILDRFKVKIISSGGTYKQIIKLGYKCEEISKYTGFKEMLDGRVKTLHPKIHAGILHDRSNKKHLGEMKRKRFPPLDLIVVNFYPFQNIITKSKNEKSIIENIDIGGPTMVRAAAKNFKNVLIITNKKDYNLLNKELLSYKGKSSLKFREIMASKAFSLTAYYDSLISNWFNKKLKIIFPERLTIFGRKYENLRYGENPHQKGSIYLSGFNDKKMDLQKISGKKLSYNNYNDMLSAIEIVRSLKKLPSTVIIKHANPCGVSSNKSPIISYKNAFFSDPLSAFGGILAVNFKINKKIAKEINKTFYEVVIADKFDKDAIKILMRRPSLRIINSSKFKSNSDLNIRHFGGKFLIQDKDEIIFNKKNLEFCTNKKFSKKLLDEAEFAFNICKFIKSNAIVITKNMSTIGIGSGQPSRVDSCKIAVSKARKFNSKNLKNSVAASDAFFPFSDGINVLARAGIKTIIQPGGSKNDKDIIKKAKKSKVNMVLTKIRHFNH